MTNPLEGLTDAHLRAALDTANFKLTPVEQVRMAPPCYPYVIAHARTIAKVEQLEAELAAMREKYEPEPVDLVEVEAINVVINDGTVRTSHQVSNIREGRSAQQKVRAAEKGIMIPRETLDRAKALLKEQLGQHADEGVRTINEIAELADDHPAVQRVALILLKNGGAA